MPRTFFSVDVETSDLNPWTGHLLTIGVEAVGSDLSHLGDFYVRIDADLDDWWYGQVGECPSETAFWWSEQSPEVQDEAFRSEALLRHGRTTAAWMLSEFVVGIAPEPEDRVFVANPVAFDKMWIDGLFATTTIDNPFHYRSLCLRSMKFGLRPMSTWGGDRETHAPKIPHHALWDAKAQADDLRSMLTERDEPKAMTS